MTGPGGDLWDDLPDGGTGPDPARDRALLHASLGGDRHAFADLVIGHRDLLWVLAARLAGDPEVAAAVLQAAVTAAYRSAPRARGEVDVRLWLAGHVVRAAAAQAAGPVAGPVAGGPAAAGVAVRAAAGPDSGGPVDVALAALPADLRTAVVLVDVAALSVDDAARVLSVPATTVLQRCARARARLAVTLGHLRNPTDPPPVIPDGDPDGTGGVP